MPNDVAVTWPYDCLSASTYKRNDRVNVPPGEFPEVWGYEGAMENACRPMSGCRFIVELAGNIDSITNAAGYSGTVHITDAFPVQLRVGDSTYADGFVYRVSDANGISRVFFKWRKPGAVSYESDRPLKLNPTVGGSGTDPREDGLQPMDVVVDGKFGYVFIAGSTPLMFYFDSDVAAAANLKVVEQTGPGPTPTLTQAPYTIASKDTNGGSGSYYRSGTNSYGNTTGAADPGENFLNLTEPSRNKKQTVAISGHPTGGTFTLTFQGQTTTDIAYDATKATVQSALEALSNIAPGDVAVTGGPGPDTAWIVEFKGTYANTDVEMMVPSSGSLTGGLTPRVQVTPNQRTHSANARVYNFSFFDSTASSHTFPNLVTNPLHGPTEFEATGGGVYVFQDFPLWTNPVFQEFPAQKKILGPTLTGVPDLATDSQYVSGLAPLDANRRYGFLIQLWDQYRTGRVSKVSRILETAPVGEGEEPYRSPTFETKQIAGVDGGGADTSALYVVAAGHRAGFPAIEIIYDSDKFDSVLVYRTVADNPKGPLSLDGIYKLTGKYTTLNQRKSSGVSLPSPWKRAFFFLSTNESQIAQQPSFDSSAFLMDEEMPKGGCAIMHEGTLIVGNIGPVDADASGMGVVRWSATTRRQPEIFSPLATYSLRFPGEEILRFVHNGPNVLGFSRQNVYLFRKEGVYMRGYHVAGGMGITSPHAACEVGSSTYVMTPTGLYTVTQNAGISLVQSVQSLTTRDWANTLSSIDMAFDQEGKCIVIHNASKKETCLMWLETSRITMLKDMVFSVCRDGPCPQNGQVAGGIQQRACFFQQVEPASGGYRWRVFTLDIARQKTVIYDGHTDDGWPMLMTLHPQGVEGRQVVAEDYTVSSGGTLKVEAAGMHNTDTVYLEGCYVYVAKAQDSNLVGRKARILNFTLNTDGGLTHSLQLEGDDEDLLLGLKAGDDLFLSPVYCMALGWAAGVVAEDGTPNAQLRDKFRERQISMIAPAFTDVSGPPTLTVPGSGLGNGYSDLARFAGVVFEGNTTSPSVRAFPAETDGSDRRSILDKAAIIGAPIEAPNGFRGANLFPGIETWVPNMDYQLLSFRVQGRVLDTSRPGRALTGGVSS